RLSARRDTVAGAIPPVDRAVVESERAKLGDPPAVEGLERVLLDVRTDEGPKARNVLLEDPERAATGSPAETERHAWRVLASVQCTCSDVTRLLEQGDPRLRPEPLAEQHRRVGPDCKRWRKHQLRDVVVVTKAARIERLQVDLKARVASLEHE